MTDTRSLRDTLTDQAEARGLSAAELARRSDTPERHVAALLAGDIQALPAFPYLRAHLLRIAEVLGLPGAQVLQQFKSEYAKMHSGALDKLPANRFALPSRRRYYIAASIACLIFISIIGIARSGFFGSPQLMITNPPDSTGTLRSNEASILLAGRITPGDTLAINGVHVPVLGDGSFSSEYRLVPELNTLEFVARRFLGRVITEHRQVYYDVALAIPAPESATTTLSDVAEPTELEVQ